MEKEEYIRKLKQLIKKNHPDLCKDTYLEEKYNRVVRKLQFLNNFLIKIAFL